jgi:hypothetical protein
MTTEQINEAWYVAEGGKIIAGPFVYNAEAWRWIEGHCGESKSMPRMATEESASLIGCCGVKDRTAADLKQIELIIRTELHEAHARIMPQIEAVLRDTYPEIP